MLFLPYVKPATCGGQRAGRTARPGPVLASAGSLLGGAARLCGSLVLALASGCCATAGQLKSHAAVDLHCPKNQIQAAAIDSRTSVAWGCGRRGTYISHCGGGSSCTWILNSVDRYSDPTP